MNCKYYNVEACNWCQSKTLSINCWTLFFSNRLKESTNIRKAIRYHFDTFDPYGTSFLVAVINKDYPEHIAYINTILLLQ